MVSMANNPSLWHGNYRGAVYPVDFNAAPAAVDGKTHHVKTLVDLAAEKIVQDSRMTSNALGILPSPLREPLLKEALLRNREMAIRCIIASWPVETLVLRNLVPEVFTSVEAVYDMEYLRDIVRQSLRYTTSLAHTFLEALKRKASTNLKYLDLTGFPTAEVIVYFLATHCMLAYNEVRHEAIRNMFEQAALQGGSNDASTGVEPMEPMEHSLPQDCSVTIKLDTFITSESTHSELCKALKVSSFPHKKLRIVIRRLGMTCLGQARVSLLLQQIQPQHLTGLQLQYNALTAQDFVKLAPALKTLVCLESLDLACNNIYFYQHPDACRAAGEVFEAMPRLHRLDLSNNRIKTRLRRLLDSISLPLTYLRLAGCSLTVTDLIYLSHSKHRFQLVELDLSENNLSACDLPLLSVITGSQATLSVLELEDCNLDGDNISKLLPALADLSALRYINISQARLTQDYLVWVMLRLAPLVTLQAFKASYSLQCYEVDIEEDRRKAVALSELEQFSRKGEAHSQRAKPMTVMLTELEQVLEEL